MSTTIGITPLEQTMIRMQLKSPGCFDGKLLNENNEAYMEARHGINPLKNGFSYGAVYRPKGGKGYNWVALGIVAGCLSIGCYQLLRLWRR
jgi:hypothetical protein